MVKHTIEISQQPLYLKVEHDQLVLMGKDDAGERVERRRYACEDVGVLLVEHAGTTFSHAALERLLHHGAAVVLCGRDHLPAGMLLPVGDHSQIVPRIQLQIDASKPLRKRLWSQIIQAKIRGQATNLKPGSATRVKLLAMARNIRSGDPTNVEAQAARAYWTAWRDSLSESSSCGTGFQPVASDVSTSSRPLCSDFHRDRDGPCPNNLLNYGYAVMRAAVARAIVAAGLVPALGLKHCHRANAFCLADDLVEPLRPLVDDRVRELVRQGHSELLPVVKAGLLELLTLDVRLGDETGPLMVCLHRMVASLVACFEGSAERLLLPTVEEAA